MSKPFAMIYTWENRPDWVDAAVEQLNTFIADPVEVICWDGHPGNGSLREICAVEDAERCALEVFDHGTPIYTLTRSKHGVPFDAVVIVTDS